MPVLFGRLPARISKGVAAIETLYGQVAIHRKKFEYVLSMLRIFAREFTQYMPENKPAPKDLINTVKLIITSLSDIHKFFGQFNLTTWTVSALSNPVGNVSHQLEKIIIQLAGLVGQICAEYSGFFEIDQRQWDHCQAYDLQAILTSFNHYIQIKKIAPSTYSQIQQKMAEISQELDKISPDIDISSIRVFSPIPVALEEWRVKSSDFILGNQIGKGLTANVYTAKNKSTGDQVAIKQFTDLDSNSYRLEMFKREVGILALLAKQKHPCLVHFLGAIDEGQFSIVTDYMPHGTLSHRLSHSPDTFSPTDRTIAAFDIARGMQYLHSVEVVHRDLKSLNVLLDSDDRVRICDFGLSLTSDADDQFKTLNLGTTPWMAPECFFKVGNQGKPVDVFAYGVVLSELATSEKPYKGIDQSTIAKQVVENNLRPALPADLPEALRDLITSCWHRDPERRPSFNEIVSKLRTGEYFFPGTDHEEFDRYMMEKATTAEQLKNEIERIIENGEVMANVSNLRRVAIPAECIDMLWDALPKVEQNLNDTERAEFLSLFFKTSKLEQAAELLSKLMPRSVPSEVMELLIEQFPSGSISTDHLITKVACKNNYAALIALYAARYEDIALALEVASYESVPDNLRMAIVDRCVQGIGISNYALNAASLRCLIGLREIKKILSYQLVNFIASPDDVLREMAILAAAAQSIYGMEVPIEVVNYAINHADESPTCTKLVIASCSKIEGAVASFSAVQKGRIKDETVKLKIAMSISRHRVLLPILNVIVNEIDIEKVKQLHPDDADLLDAFASKVKSIPKQGK